MTDTVKYETMLGLQKIVIDDGPLAKWMIGQGALENAVSNQTGDRCGRHRAIGDSLVTVFDLDKRFEPCETVRTVANNGRSRLT